MRYISIIDKENEWFFNDNIIEWRDGLKTRTQSNVSSFIVNDDFVVTSDMSIKYVCDTCGKEIISKFSNFKKRKSNECISCIRKRTVKKSHSRVDKEKRREINKKISEKTKQAMSKISPEKREEMTNKMKDSMDWQKRNEKWLETMSSKSEKEKSEMYEKISKTMKKRYREQGPWNLKNIYNPSKYSTIDCKYYQRGIHSTTEKIKIICDSCGKEFETSRLNAARQEKEHPGFTQCFICVSSSKSHKEKEIVDFIKSYDIDVIENSKNVISPQELDIYIPSKNIAIEFNGLYWHSEQNGIEKNYHINKTLECEKNGIKLIHIFQDDWEHKKEIVEARLKHLLGLNKKRIGARKTKICEISTKDKNDFLNKYHIQGSDRSNIKLGAYYNGELIAVVTFSKNRNFNRKKRLNKSWELSRFATIDDTYTPGLANKMLKYFETNYDWSEIFSYADRCWSQGNMYYSIGFEFESYTQPSYWYSKNGLSIREHRYNYRKQNLKTFPNYSDEKTEKQIMDELGYLRIYDCGNYKFIKKAPSEEGAKNF